MFYLLTNKHKQTKKNKNTTPTGVSNAVIPSMYKNPFLPPLNPKLSKNAK